MATVRMSRRLRDQILSAAMFDYQKTVSSSDEIRVELDQIISANWHDSKPMQDAAALEKILTNAAPSLGQHARDYIDRMTTSDAIVDDIKVQIDVKDSYSTRTKTLEYKYRFPDRLHLKNIAIQTGTVSWRSVVLTPEAFGDKAERLKELIKLREDRRQQQDKDESNFRRSVRDLLEQCNTVKQLLTAWPAASKLLPDAVIQKMHEKVERKFDAEAAKARANFDPTEANTTMLTAALLGDVA